MSVTLATAGLRLTRTTDYVDYVDFMDHMDYRPTWSTIFTKVAAPWSSRLVVM